MATRADAAACARLYRQRSLRDSVSKNNDFLQWQTDYLESLTEWHETIVTTVKGVNPDFDTFCRCMYESCKHNFDVTRLNRNK